MLSPTLVRLAVFLSVTLCVLGFALLCPAEELSEFDEIVEMGWAFLDENISEDVVAMIETGEIDWQVLGYEIEASLESFSLEDLAFMLPEARRALAYLETIPGGEPYAAWLRQRLDYIEMAERVLVPPPRPAPPLPKPTSRPPTPTPRPEPTIHREADIETWKQTLAGRKEPKNAGHIVPRLKEVFTEEGIPSEWVWMAEVESSLNPRARSPAGAVGLFQFMPATARQFGLRTSFPDERLEPDKSARAAAQYLKYLHGRVGSWPLALAAYNAGEGRVLRAMKLSKAQRFEDIVDHLPAETRMYVPKVMATVALREGIDPTTLPPPSG